MKRLFALAVIAVIAIAGVAMAAPRIRLVVPVEISNLPAAISRGQIQCIVSSAPAFDGSLPIGEAHTEFAIEGGRYSGRLAMDVIPEGAPLGEDGTLDGHSYSCTLLLMYRCTSATAPSGWCVSNAGGAPRPGASPSVRALFATDPARPPVGVIQGTIDRGGATTLPVRDL